MRLDAFNLLMSLYVPLTWGEQTWPIHEAERLKMHPRRMYYILSRWEDRDWLEYGVSSRFGWLTEAGRAIAASLHVMVTSDLSEEEKIKIIERT